MKKENKTIAIVAGVGVLGLAYYLYQKNKAGSSSSSTSLVSSLTDTAPVTTAVPPSVTVAPPPQTIAPLPITAPPAPVQTVTADSVSPAAAANTLTSQQSTVISFFRTDLDEANLNQLMNVYPSFTASDWAGLYDLIVNDWQGGQGNTTARKVFWDNWRVKYHVLDGTYS